MVGHERISMMTLTCAELIDLCSLGKGLRHWTLAYPCHENSLGVRVLRESCEFLPAAEIHADTQFSSILSSIVQLISIKRGQEITVP
jgi:hypothetical protein